jgi:hypothetical protein
MKRKVFGIIAIAVIIAVATVNVKLSLKDSFVFHTSLKVLESHAGIGETVENWWNSEVYKCTLKPCSVVNYYAGTVHQGDREICEDGDKVAHCRDCATECVIIAWWH